VLDQVTHSSVNVVHDAADGFEILVGGVVDVPVLIPFAGGNRARCAAAHGVTGVVLGEDLGRDGPAGVVDAGKQHRGSLVNGA
jgi:hypothetical protein